MANNGLHIDPEKFAFEFAKVARKMNYKNSDLIPEAKKFLLSYLSAYYLISDFNKIEQTDFKNGDGKELSFDQLIDKIQQMNADQMFKG
ncbi:hypothetical protein [Lactobacillus crispatus]|uniref:Uncharacterized protein n=1 Tax=Lactobacillus crispatus TaxID=47770 RepID=A0A7H9E7A7_9LACO|nr:hypothetical protein [Lactobacillus crispatus]QLL73523.1 hypothetical protein GTO85_03630 [Lactobacillus crispatus]